MFTDFRFGGLAIATLGTMLPYLAMMVAIDVAESTIVSRDGNCTSDSWLVAPVMSAPITLTILYGSESGGEFIYFAF